METNFNLDQGIQTDIEQKEDFSSIYLCPLDHKGTNSYIKEWKPAKVNYPPIVLLHDLGRSINPYKNLAKALQEVGFQVFCVDLRSHGYSSLSTGLGSFMQLVSDLLQVVAWSRYKTDKRSNPIILADGFSALVSIYFAKLYPSYCSSLILSNPMMEFPIRMGGLTRIIVKILSKFRSSFLSCRIFFIKKIQLKLGDFIKSSIDKGNEFEYSGIDQLCSLCGAKFIDDLIEATLGSFETFQGIREPTLLLNPKNERIADISLFMLEEHLDKTKVRIKEFDANYHLSSDQSKDAIVKAILEWADSLYKK